jgi:hypothetical protein
MLNEKKNAIITARHFFDSSKPQTDLSKLSQPLRLWREAIQGGFRLMGLSGTRSFLSAKPASQSKDNRMNFRITNQTIFLPAILLSKSLHGIGHV